MKTLVTILSLFILSIPAALAKDGSFVSRVVHENESVLFNLSYKQWIKITDFVESTSTSTSPIGAITVYQGAEGLPGSIILLASAPGTTYGGQKDVFIAGPMVVYIAPPQAGSTFFLTYLTGSN
jgi:hypothetical protein